MAVKESEQLEDALNSSFLKIAIKKTRKIEIYSIKASYYLFLAFLNVSLVGSCVGVSLSQLEELEIFL